MNKDLISKVFRMASWNEESIESVIRLDRESLLGNKSKLWHLKNKDGKEWVIKKYPPWIMKRDLAWIHEYIKLLYKKMFPLCINKGESIQVDGHCWAIYEFAIGNEFEIHNTRHFEDMAIKLRRLHDISSSLNMRTRYSWSSVANFNPNYALVEKIYKKMPQQISPEYIKTLINKACRIYESFVGATNSGNTFPIHGDFITKNMKFTTAGISKVFDFGNARSDYFEADIALTLSNLCEEFKSDNWKDIEHQFLIIYKSSHFENLYLSPKLICISGLVFLIRECIYLCKEYLLHPEDKLINDLEEKTRALELFIERLPIQTELVGKFFKDSQ